VIADACTECSQLRTSVIVLLSLIGSAALADNGPTTVDDLRRRIPFVDTHMAMPTRVHVDPPGAAVGEHRMMDGGKLVW
jgi:hypothetical protein